MKDRQARGESRRKRRHAKEKAARRPRSLGLRFTLFLLKAGLTLVMLLALVAGGTFMAIEAGLLDKTLTARAEGALNGAVGPRYLATVDSTAIRFANNRQLAIEARKVVMKDQQTGRVVSETGAIRLALDPFRLFQGELTITRIEADDVRFDTALFSTGEGLDLTRARVDQIPGLVDNGFAQLDLFGGFIDRARTDALEIRGMELLAAGPDGKDISVGKAHFLLERREDSTLSMDGALEIKGDAVPFTVVAERRLGKTVSLKASVHDVPLLHFGPGPDWRGRIEEKLEATAFAEISAKRRTEDVFPEIAMSARVNPGTLTLHGIPQKLDGAQLEAIYDFSKNSVEFLPSSMRFAETSLPFTGGLIDLDRIRPEAGKGFGIDFLVKGGKVFTEAAAAAPADLDAQASGYFLSETRELVFDQMTASTHRGSIIGSLKMKFGDKDPEISFAAQVTNAQMQAVKQLWPFWIAPNARKWVSENMFAGSVSNGSIAVFVPATRVRDSDGSLKLSEDQLNISLDVSNARMNIAGDIPPLRGTTGHVEIKGSRLTADIKSGTSYFPTDRSVNIDGGTFSIPDFSEHPLTAETDVTVSGAADAVAELITYRPIRFLGRAGLKPEDLAGNIRAHVKARFGLNSKDDVTPEWTAAMTLTNVDVVKPLQGRRLTALTGTADITPDQAVLKAKGKIDGVPMELDAIEPFDDAAADARSRQMTMVLGTDDIARLFPNLEQVVSGTVRAKVSMKAEGVQDVEADLASATLKVPGSGWKKGAGIPAKAKFEVVRGEENMEVRNLVVTGDGFGASGRIEARNGKLVVAAFERVKLAANDNFGLTVRPIRSGFDVAVSGSTLDARAALNRLRNAGTEEKSGKPVTMVLRAKVEKIYGFGEETLRNVDLAYAPLTSDGGKLQLSALTGAGQPVVGQMVEDGRGRFMQLTSGDAGATFRFLGLYSRLQKGLLNMRLRPGKEGSWNGNIDVRDFRLANEERLQSMVSTPADKDGRSLNKAVKRDIDVRSEKFQRGFAFFTYHDGTLAIENGVLRGTQVGATFQGVVRDAAGKMDVTGTFMPAYGLNRLFGELPVIGILLGNGRDRGLLGITFKLTGPFEKPNLTINPLSIIAPGIFRQVFEFQ